MRSYGLVERRVSMQEWRLGSYELLRRLGEGGMAQVYLARDVRLGREVAVKVLDRKLAERPGFRERFEREARVAAALDHPNIVPLYDFGESGVLYLVMPFVSGGSLQEMLNRTPFTMGAVATYGSQIADALAYAHQRNVVHRDVKPANMLLHADGRLMLSDFGLAKIIDQANRVARPRNHPDAGTPEYMAPEQVNGHSDERSDIYALGVVLYLLLTGRLPFTGSSSNAVMEGHLYRMPESPRRLNPGVSVAMEAVVMRALSKRPEDRFQRASELGAALLGALIAGSPSAPPSAISRPHTSSYPVLPQVRPPYGPQGQGYDGRQQSGQPGQSGRQPRPRPANPTAPISSLSSPLPGWHAPIPSLPDLPDLTHLGRAREAREAREANGATDTARVRDSRATQPPGHASQTSYATEALPRLDRAGQPVNHFPAAQTPTLGSGLSQTSHSSLATDTSVSSQVTPRPAPALQPPLSATQPGRADAPTGPRPNAPARPSAMSGPQAPFTASHSAQYPGVAGDPRDPRQQSHVSQAGSYFSGASPVAASDPWQSLQSGQATGRPTGRLGQMGELGHGLESAPTGAMGTMGARGAAGALGTPGWPPQASAARPFAPTALAYPSSPTLPALSAGSPGFAGAQDAADSQDSQALLNEVAAQPTLTAPLASFWRATGAPSDGADALDVARTILPGPISGPRVPARAAQSTRRQSGEREIEGAVGRERGQIWALVTTLLIILLLMAGILLRWLQTGGPMFFH